MDIIWEGDLSEKENYLRRRMIWEGELSEKENYLRRRIMWEGELSEKVDISWEGELAEKVEWHCAGTHLPSLSITRLIKYQHTPHFYHSTLFYLYPAH